jgi:hypothetical protein
MRKHIFFLFALIPFLYVMLSDFDDPSQNSSRRVGAILAFAFMAVYVVQRWILVVRGIRERSSKNNNADH